GGTGKAAGEGLDGDGETAEDGRTAEGGRTAEDGRTAEGAEPRETTAAGDSVYLRLHFSPFEIRSLRVQ
ncbi:MAG: hypothetical protein ACLFM0_06505, partial [Spirochaetales bacterium]